MFVGVTVKLWYLFSKIHIPKEGNGANHSARLFLRRLARVCNCYDAFETRNDYEKVFLAMWANHEYLYKSPPNYSFANYLKN